jgi:hypothetical protein
MQVFRLEGASDPFIARMWAGFAQLRDWLPTESRPVLERLYPLETLDGARERAKTIFEILDTHQAALASGQDVSRAPSVLYLPQSIDPALQREFAAFVLEIFRTYKTTQDLLRAFDIEIEEVLESGSARID